MYRYGFNGKEKDPEFQNNYDYGFRIYNPNIAKFLSVDPLTKGYPYYTPYQFAGNKPIVAIDLDGAEEKYVIHWLVEYGSSRQTALLAAPTIEKITGISKNQTLLAFGIYNGLASSFDVLAIEASMKQYGLDYMSELFDSKLDFTNNKDAFSFDRIKKLMPFLRMAEDSYKSLKAKIDEAYKGDPYAAGQVFGLALTANIGEASGAISQLKGLGLPKGNPLLKMDGLTIMANEESLAYLSRDGGSEAAYWTLEGGEGIVMLRPGYSRQALFEEIIHHNQRQKYGEKYFLKNNELIEIEAQDELLKIGKKEGWSKKDINQIKRAKETWTKKLKNKKP